MAGRRRSPTADDTTTAVEVDVDFDTADLREILEDARKELGAAWEHAANAEREIARLKPLLDNAEQRISRLCERLQLEDA